MDAAFQRHRGLRTGGAEQARPAHFFPGCERAGDRACRYSIRWGLPGPGHGRGPGSRYAARMADPGSGPPGVAVLSGRSRDPFTARAGGTATVTSAPPLVGGIIAAGEGSRLRQAGFPVPKPMVRVAGVPLLESVIRNLMAAGISRISIIVNA